MYGVAIPKSANGRKGSNPLPSSIVKGIMEDDYSNKTLNNGGTKTIID